MSLQGVWRGKNKITTNSRDDQQRADDLVKRNFTAKCPNQLWVADFTYIKTTSGWVYTVFIIDVFARSIVGWKVANRMNTALVLDALEQALSDRGKPKDVIHHSDKGSQYLSIRYTDRIAEVGVQASVSTTGDSYENALAEAVNGLYNWYRLGYRGIRKVTYSMLDIVLTTFGLFFIFLGNVIKIRVCQYWNFFIFSHN